MGKKAAELDWRTKAEREELYEFMRRKWGMWYSSLYVMFMVYLFPLGKDKRTRILNFAMNATVRILWSFALLLWLFGVFPVTETFSLNGNAGDDIAYFTSVLTRFGIFGLFRTVPAILRALRDRVKRFINEAVALQEEDRAKKNQSEWTQQEWWAYELLKELNMSLELIPYIYNPNTIPELRATFELLILGNAINMKEEEWIDRYVATCQSLGITHSKTFTTKYNLWKSSETTDMWDLEWKDDTFVGKWKGHR